MSDDSDSSNVVTPEDKLKGGGKKKSNGHKATCSCPICKNMMHAKKGGSQQHDLRPATFTGGKKANGHKENCKCPICVNMKHQKASKKNRRVTRRSRDMEEEEEEEMKGGEEAVDKDIGPIKQIVVVLFVKICE